MTTSRSDKDLIWIKCNGSRLEVREVSEPLMVLESRGAGKGPPLAILDGIFPRIKARAILQDYDQSQYVRKK